MTLKEQLRQAYDEGAPNYDSHTGHNIPESALNRYITDLEEVVGSANGRHALDIGCGTGFMTQILQQAGYQVSGVDFSAEMLNIARQRLPNVPFVLVNDIEEAFETYPPASFDLVVSRQVVCHLTDPIHTFGQWSNWLKPDGYLVVIEGIWSRNSWTNQWAQYPDQLPLSCTQTPATVAYMMKKAGLSIQVQEWLTHVNEYERLRATADQTPTVRYIVVGQKSR